MDISLGDFKGLLFRGSAVLRVNSVNPLFVDTPYSVLNELWRSYSAVIYTQTERNSDPAACFNQFAQFLHADVCYDRFDTLDWRGACKKIKVPFGDIRALAEILCLNALQYRFNIRNNYRHWIQDRNLRRFFPAYMHFVPSLDGITNMSLKSQEIMPTLLEFLPKSKVGCVDLLVCVDNDKLTKKYNINVFRPDRSFESVADGRNALCAALQEKIVEVVHEKVAAINFSEADEKKLKFIALKFLLGLSEATKRHEPQANVAKEVKDSPEEIEQIAADGTPDSMYAVGCCFMEGQVTAKDVPRALSWLVKAADNGHLNAMKTVVAAHEADNQLGLDPQKAFGYYSLLADMGDMAAQLKMSSAFRRGKYVEKDESKALQWCLKSAEQGYANAQYNAALFYDNGIGAECDKKAAFEWALKAANNGHEIACCYVGTCFQQGDPIACDLLTAAKWFIKACESGNARAQEYLSSDPFFGYAGLTEDKFYEFVNLRGAILLHGNSYYYGMLSHNARKFIKALAKIDNVDSRQKLSEVYNELDTEIATAVDDSILYKLKVWAEIYLENKMELQDIPSKYVVDKETVFRFEVYSAFVPLLDEFCKISCASREEARQRAGQFVESLGTDIDSRTLFVFIRNFGHISVSMADEEPEKLSPASIDVLCAVCQAAVWGNFRFNDMPFVNVPAALKFAKELSRIEELAPIIEMGPHDPLFREALSYYLREADGCVTNVLNSHDSTLEKRGYDFWFKRLPDMPADAVAVRKALSEELKDLICEAVSVRVHDLKLKRSDIMLARRLKDAYLKDWDVPEWEVELELQNIDEWPETVYFEFDF